MVGLISSISEEGKKIVREIKISDAFAAPHFRIIRGQIYNKNVVYAASGIGKTNAAHAATILIENFAPELVILFGVGGAYPSSGLRIGDIAIAKKEAYGDEGVMVKDGFHGAESIGIPLLKKGGKKYFNEFPMNKSLIRRCLSIIKLAPYTLPLAPEVKSGTFVTVSTCTGTRKKASELEERFSAICENMEGAAVAHVCAMYGTPMLEIRGISNIVEDRDKSKWDLKLASDNCQKVVTELLNHL